MTSRSNCSHLTRREATAGLMVGWGALAKGTSASAQGTLNFASDAIDIHHHFLPPFYKSLAKPWLDRYATGVAGVLAWTPERSLAAMDAARVRHAVLSISAPGVSFGDSAEARRVAAACNDYAAALARDHRDRFSFFAALPMPDVVGSMAEFERALVLPGCRGISLLTNYEGRYLGDPAFRPLFDHLAARGALVYVHPTSAPCCADLVPNVPTPLIEFPVDTGRTIASLLWGGVLSGVPRVRFVFSHGGGVLPMVLERVSSVARARPDLARHVPEGPEAALARLFVDTASVTTRPAMAALNAWLPATNVLYGTDYPWGEPARARAGLGQLGLSADRLAAIEHRNASALLGIAEA